MVDLINERNLKANMFGGGGINEDLKDRGINEDLKDGGIKKS